MATKAIPFGGDTTTLETLSTEMWQPTNYFNLKCTMTEGSVDKIVSAIYLMMEGISKNAGLDFSSGAETVLDRAESPACPEVAKRRNDDQFPRRRNIDGTARQHGYKGRKHTVKLV